MNASIFKAYDIRGLYPSQIDEKAAYNIGRAAAEYLQAKRIAVGRDARSHSPALFKSLAEGITDAGCDVIDLGLLTTPMVYFAAGNLDVDAAISVTASHNPPEYNGLKICRRGALPVGENSGLFDIRDLALSENFSTPEAKGTITQQDIKEKYYDHFATFAQLGEKRFKVVIDTANAMGILELPIFRRLAENIDLTTMYDDLSHPFSAHEANPLKTETLDELRAKVKEIGADLGIAYDGDADRVGFVDELGEIIPMDHTTGLLARDLLKKHPGATILYDLRSSKAVKEIVEENGGIALESKVGHANIKKQMRDEGAIFAGELSGHYYFKENSFAEAGSLPAIMLLNLMSETDKKVSELAADLKRYHHTEEINSEVEDKDAVLLALKEKYADGKQHELDGLSVEYSDWWFNVRPSNTEPLLRLNLEADTAKLMAAKQAEVLGIIRG